MEEDFLFTKNFTDLKIMNKVCRKFKNKIDENWKHYSL